MCADIDDFRNRSLEETHTSQYSIHPGAKKMYPSLQQIYWLDGLKRYVVGCVVRRPNCQEVKAEHQKMEGLNQVINVTPWKWEENKIDFIVGFLQTRR